MRNIYDFDNDKIKNLIGKSFFHSQSGLVFNITDQGYEIDGNIFTKFHDLIHYIAEETGIFEKSIFASFFYEDNNLDSNFVSVYNRC